MSVTSSSNYGFPIPGGTTSDSRLGDIQATKAALTQIDAELHNLAQSQAQQGSGADEKLRLKLSVNNGAVVDDVGNAATMLGTVVATGTSELKLNGSSAVWCPTASAMFGLFDFTLQAWVRHNTVQSWSPYMQAGNHSSVVAGTWFFTRMNGALSLAQHGPGGIVVSAPWVPVANEWSHVAAVRSEGVVRLFVNGQKQVESDAMVSASFNTSGVLVGSIATPYYLDGDMKGVEICRSAKFWDNFTPVAA